VIAARTILALQTIVSREVKPGEFAVVTVGYVTAGTKNNIIPDSAELGLTVRSRSTAVRKQVLEAITRITNAEAQAAGAPRAPAIDHYEAADVVYNDPALAQRSAHRPGTRPRQEHVVTQEPITAPRTPRSSSSRDPGFYLGLEAQIREVCAGGGKRHAPAVQSLIALRARHRSRAAHGNRGRGLRCCASCSGATAPGA
jgi:metal-dependent amidase/aminoacylase/carboxypeptidase family protein